MPAAVFQSAPHAWTATGLRLAQPAGHPQNLGVTEIVPRDELQAVIEARAELGAEMEPAVIDAFVERLERRIAEGAADREQALRRKRDHQKEIVLGAMGISVPLLAIAAIFTGLAGLLVVCGARSNRVRLDAIAGVYTASRLVRLVYR
jgi:hypothetical protein